MSTQDQDHAGHSHGDVSERECADYLEQIVYFIDNELAEADCDAVRVHLDTCNPCLEKYDLQRTVKSVVARSCSEAAPEELRQRVMFRIREVQVRISDS
ncbi:MULTISPECIES: mycothiol system anti-sigma-R factor [Nocardioides]|uniref:Mycothiol system anti-sigma-R factor n=1 Tax=Nocardioides lianchengensis TaxID=1045774 RepID=A0A1G7BLE2_9ACTN|nr:mycothiol system anti-sigma-R factor [Nocardioides lianchengensis]NYG08949.1 mycothiol system anti-sigma-R factor [Nocardioides lianchengensis]SDE27914.1 mycothiol system anti-sigma-R factor [Nocardioides lianchengensis]